MHALPAILLAGLVALLSVALPPIEPRPDKPQTTETAPRAPGFAEAVRPLLNSYCFACHNTNKRKGGLELEQIDTAAALELFDLWAKVGERVRGKEMPPESRKQPTEDERQTLLAWVKHVAESQVDYDKLPREQLERLVAGRTLSRRLSRVEYNNTLRDLFGVDLHAGDLLPSEGGGGEGFDNAGATLFTTPVLLEKYLEAAELVLGTLLPTAGNKPPAASKLEAQQLEAVRRNLLVAVPGPQTTPREAARKVLGAFLPRAFRRPATAKELERYLGPFDHAVGKGEAYESSLRVALKAVLISPSFLFLTETPPDKTGVYRLDHYEVASHLSYFLWASMPDAELLRLAGEGRLHDEQVLRGQVRRMLRDLRSRSLADGFAAQWLGIRPLGATIRPDARLFPEFSEELAAAMREETALFFDAIVREERSVLEILDADFTFVNERLAEHYGIAGVKGPQMRRVALDDPRRGGVLGQASILTVTSFPHRTSAVLRGRWILDELLGTEVPPPPPDVPVLNERRKQADKPTTLRELLEKHRSKAECASCHNRMDPLGFGLENFDALGRWRTEQGGKPIDSVGVLPTGERFDGPVELKRLLLDKRRPEFLHNFCRKLLGYALGREIARPDLVVVKDCVRALEQGQYRSSRLLEAIVVSYPFSHRQPKP
jgi:mono/diheme cytochrome c family protein